MIGICAIYTGKTPGGNYKAYVWGTVNGHCSDHRGCNFRYKPLPDQPVLGFKTRGKAEKFARERFDTIKAASDWADRAGDGNFFPDKKFKEMELKYVPGRAPKDK